MTEEPTAGWHPATKAHWIEHEEWAGRLAAEARGACGPDGKLSQAGDAKDQLVRWAFSRMVKQCDWDRASSDDARFASLVVDLATRVRYEERRKVAELVVKGLAALFGDEAHALIADVAAAAGVDGD